MKTTEVMDLVNRLEDEGAVQEWRLHGFRLWPLVRMELGFGLDDFLPHPRPSRLRGALPERVKVLARAARALRDGVALARRQAAAEAADEAHADRIDREVDAVFLTMSTARRFALRGGMYCGFSDPIVDLFAGHGRSSFVLELAPRGEYRVPRFRKSFFVQRDLEALGRCHVAAARDAAALRREPAFRALEAEALRLGGHPAVAASTIATQALRIRRWADYFKRRLEVLRPSIALSYGWYDAEGMALDLACRELGVASIDVQHGVQGPLHVAYGRWRRVPSSGYELLPDIFWTWGDDEARAIREWNGEVRARHDAVAAGNVLMDAFQRDGSDLCAQYLERLDAARGGAARPSVLVALGRVPGVPPLVREAIAAAPPSWHWWVRVHPGMLEERSAIERTLRELGARSVDVALATEAPLYALLRRTDVLLTEVSSTVLEARSFGVRSVVAHPSGAELYRAEAESGWARVALDAKAIVEALAAQLAARAAGPPARSALHEGELGRILALFRPRLA